MEATANVNGLITPASEAKISIFDRGFLYGDSIYEAIRTYDGVPFLYDEHFARLENSARLAGINLGQSREFLKAEIRRTVEASMPSKADELFIRFTITRGDGNLDLDPNAVKNTNYVLLVRPLTPWNPKFFSEGMTLAIPPIRRNSPLALDPNIKSGNYLNNVLAVGEARKLGADDALLLSIEGKLTEASNSNVCFVIGNRVLCPLHEPGTSTGNLRGLTKIVVADVCANVELEFKEKPLKPTDISTASECFVSSATREIMPIRALILEGGKRLEFPAGGGKATHALRREYKRFVAEYTKVHSGEALF